MFYITISNGLLDPQHCKKIGPAAWEFMWFIDKVTKIDEQGFGWVLGGKPIQLSDLAKDLGRHSNTISRNIHRLAQSGYILITAAPYGLVIRVRKAKKRFTKNGERFTK